MSTKDKIYVTGHLHPDTDSIASAIGYAFYKRAMGENAIPCRLGDVNAESRYLLERFGFETPRLLKDARVKLEDITLDPLTYISPDTTILEAMRFMQEESHSYCGVVDEERRLLGMITKSDIGVIGLGDTKETIKILKHTPVQNFAGALEGEVLYEADETHINGNVSIVARAASSVDKYEVKDRIVIVGNDHDAQMELIQNGAGILILVWTEQVAEDVFACAKEHHCHIIRSGHGATNTVRYLYFAPPVHLIMKQDLVRFHTNELAEDVGKKMLRSRFHVYPVVDDENRLVGYASRYHILNAENKKIIMVDHNEFSQSVRAIEKARVLEVIDHHRINDFSTSQPVRFRNEIVGSTATIVATIYRENQVPIPPNIAGLLLGALLSDTMDFHSPTTTPKDKETANILAALAGLDMEEFAADLFAVTADPAGRTMKERIGTDIKFFEIEGVSVAISQVMVNHVEDIREQSIAIQTEVDTFTRKKNLDLCVVAFTSIVDDGSVVYVSGDKAEWVQEAFPDKEGESHSLQVDVLSRKQQLLPRVTEAVRKYS